MDLFEKINFKDSSKMKYNNYIRKPSKETAEKALLEAEIRNRKLPLIENPKEINGPSDLEPTRYGDWERRGIISDF